MSQTRVFIVHEREQQQREHFKQNRSFQNKKIRIIFTEKIMFEMLNRVFLLIFYTFTTSVFCRSLPYFDELL